MSAATLRSFPLRLALATLLAGALAACAGIRRELESNELIDLDRAERDAATAPASDPAFRVEDIGRRERPARTITRDQATGGIDDAVATPGEPAQARAGDRADSVPVDVDRPLERRADVVVRAPVDALVGQVAGRPIFASEFFAPMDARLRAKAREVSDREFLVFLRQQIHQALIEHVRDELLLAEFEATLTPQQRRGLTAFIGRVRQGILSENRGSVEIANQRLLQDEGVTLEEKVEQLTRQEFARQQIGNLLRNRAWISWREVVQTYARNSDRYNPPATARLRMIWVPADDRDAIERVQAQLDEGVPFERVAREFSVFNPEQGGLNAVRLADGGYDQTAFFGAESLNERARALEPGETVGPFDYASYRAWLTLEGIEHRSQSLYEVQIEIRDRLQQERLAEVQSDFFSNLLDSGGLSTEDIDRMERRLLEIGAERYLVASREG